MRKIILIFLTALIGTLILGGCSGTNKIDVVLKSQNVENTDNSWEMVKEHGALRVGIQPDGLPNVEIKPNGSYNGFLIDIMNEIGKRAEIDIEYVEIGENTVSTMLTNSTIDVVLNGYTQADNGNKSIKWLEPYMTNHHIIICSSYSDINTKEDLADKKTGVTTDTVSDMSAQSDIKIDNEMLVKFDTERKALNALANRHIDALIIEDTQYYYNEKYHYHNYRILDEILSTHVHSLGVSKEKTQLAEKLTTVMSELKADQTLEKISTKWFNVNLIN